MNPFKFKPNRVRRSYTGGKGIDALRGVYPEQDGEYPEDWIASAVKAFSRPGEPEDAGLSIIEGYGESETTFADLLQSNAKELLGEKHIAAFGNTTGFLMKLLDSAIRLPLQAHPDKEKAMQLFGSPYGKNEAWLVVGTRTDTDERPYLLFGFNEKLDRDVFYRESIDGVLDKSLEMMHKVEVKAGDAFMIPGGLPHAIGPGLTVIEIMEPTDWIVLSEKHCGDILISDERRFNGLDPQAALEMYDFTPQSAAEIKDNYKQIPQKVDDSLCTIINREETKYFGLQKLALRGGHYTLKNNESCCRAGIVLSGTAHIGNLELATGDTFFLPAGNEAYAFTGEAEIILALPPVA